jgi:hypothetical protein
LRIAPATVRGAIDAVLDHQLTGGGFATYRLGPEVQALIDIAGDDQGARGWLAPQTCVTSVALEALLMCGEPPTSPAIREGVEFLRATRSSTDGIWESYWWLTDLYATYAATKVLAWTEAASTAERRRIVSVVLDRRKSPGWGDRPNEGATPFPTSLGVLIALLAPEDRLASQAAAAATAWIVSAQRPDGGWTPSAQLRLRESELGPVTYRLDENALFTTATVLHALAVARRVMTPPITR